MTRSLRLTRETLAELSSDDLAAVVGAADDSVVACSLVPKLVNAIERRTPLCPTE